MKKTETYEILKTKTNNYGNIDIRDGVPKHLVHIKGARLQPLCRKLEIPYAEALTGFSKPWRYTKPDLDGVVISRYDRRKLEKAIEEREVKAQKRADKEAEKLARKQKQRRNAYALNLQTLTPEQRKVFPETPNNAAEYLFSHLRDITKAHPDWLKVAYPALQYAINNSKSVFHSWRLGYFEGDFYEMLCLCITAHRRHTETDYDDILFFEGHTMSEEEIDELRAEKTYEGYTYQ